MSDFPETPGSRPGLAAALADRYTIERELGRGGNATVYLAYDLKHKRKVAVKVLLPDLAQSVRIERFLQEIEIAAGLTHPHILPIYDSGEAQDFLYYVMPYVAGESLRERLTREKQLPVEDALRIARDVAEALGYAHDHGVVHRDIKPENILLSEGGAVVADFGIARALTEAGGHSVTQTGMAVGTPAYMSPEQGSGSGELDGRSDIYSLGCVLYEMLAGHPPFTGATAQEILARHALDPVPTLRAAREAVPEGIERAVRRALAKQPVDRFATLAQFLDGLAAPVGRPHSRRTVLASVGLGVALFAGIGGFVWHAKAGGPADRSVAVLPFVNMSGDSTQTYLSDGISEELIDALARLKGLRVAARTSSFAFRGREADVRKIGRSLDVAAVVEGSVRKSGNRLRVTAQLINVADGYHLWSNTYEQEFKEVFAVEDAVTKAIVGALQLKLAGGDSTVLVQPQTQNLEAYDLYLKGRQVWKTRNGDAVRKAMQYFEAAITKDSGYALAYSGLADSYIVGAGDGLFPRGEAYTKALGAALKAVALDSTLAEAYTSLARARYIAYWDAAGAERDYLRAIALNPNYVLAHSWYGLWLVLQGRTGAAIREGKLAQRLDPLPPGPSNTLGVIYHDAGRIDDAIREFRKCIAADSEWNQPHWFLAQDYLLESRFDEALAEANTAVRLKGGAVSLATLGAVYARTGRRAEALTIVRQLKNRPERALYAEAIVYAGLGDTSQALASLEAGADTPLFFGVPTNLRNPLFKPLHGSPRFTAVLRRAGVKS